MLWQYDLSVCTPKPVAKSLKSLFQKRLCMSYLKTASCIDSIVCEWKYWTIIITPLYLIDINIKNATFN